MSWKVDVSFAIECRKEDTEMIAAVLSHSMGVEALQLALENLLHTSLEIHKMVVRETWVSDKMEFV